MRKSSPHGNDAVGRRRKIALHDFLQRPHERKRLESRWLHKVRIFPEFGNIHEIFTHTKNERFSMMSASKEHIRFLSQVTKHAFEKSPVNNPVKFGTFNRKNFTKTEHFCVY
jgi:hypothetical protein